MAVVSTGYLGRVVTGLLRALIAGDAAAAAALGPDSDVGRQMGYVSAEEEGSVARVLLELAARCVLAWMKSQEKDFDTLIVHCDCGL